MKMLNIRSLIVREPQKKFEAVAVLLFGGLGVFTASANAGIITSGPYIASGSAGNASANVINTPTFMITSAAKSFTSIGPLDFVFPVNPSGATATYFVTEGITNNTGQTWTDYHEQIGTGVDGNFVLDNDPVTFVTPPDATYTNPDFPSRSVTADDIDYTGGAVAPGHAISITFSINVPDGPSVYDFTLRQFPTVPEPATIGLLALGSMGLLARRHRR